MKEKILAYITLYFDQKNSQICIDKLFDQSYFLNTILLVDNSFEKIILNLKNNSLVIHKPENIGISGGLNLAIQWAIENKFDFLWTFDQDSQPPPDCLEILLSEYEYLQQQNIPVGIIAPTIIDSQTQTELPNGYLTAYKFNWLLSEYADYYREKLYRCDAVITSGSLINLKAAKNTPLPNPDLFIDGVDWDYCLKLRKQGYHICVTEKTTMQHNFGTYLTHLNSQQPIYIYSPLRYYYINRNHTYIETRLSNNLYYKILSHLHRLKSLIKKIGKIIIYEPDQKILKIWASCLGFYHGLIGKLGKTWLP